MNAFQKLLFLFLITITVAGCQGETEQNQQVNILFYIADDMSPFSPSQQIPSFRRVGDEGVVFTNAFTNAPSCTPARGIVLTGQHLWDLREGGTLFGALPSDLPVFPLLLEEAGYFVGHTGKAWGPGSLEAGGWSPEKNPVGKPYTAIKLDPPPAGMANHDYAANFEAFLTDKPADQPFFFWYGSFEPHRRFEAGQGVAAGKTLADAVVPASMPDHEIIRNDILDYDIEVEYADQHLGRMLTLLEQAGELTHTIVIVTSDHGLAFPRAKATGLYDDATHIPLMMMGPGIKGTGRSINDFVGLMDLGPTILDLAGLVIPPDMKGQSLVPHLRTDQTGRIEENRNQIVLALERHTIARPDYLGYPMRALRTDDFLLVHNFEPDRWPAGDPDYDSIHQGIYGDIDAGPAKEFIKSIAEDPDLGYYHQLATGRRPRIELFDLSTDPAQLTNVATEAAYTAVADSLEKVLNAYLVEVGDPRARGHSPWDQNIYYFGDLPDVMPTPDPTRWDAQ